MMISFRNFVQSLITEADAPPAPPAAGPTGGAPPMDAGGLGAPAGAPPMGGPPTPDLGGLGGGMPMGGGAPPTPDLGGLGGAPPAGGAQQTPPTKLHNTDVWYAMNSFFSGQNKEKVEK
jgi:hypothetical protein